MFPLSSSPTRRDFLATSALATSAAFLTATVSASLLPLQAAAATDGNAIRSFHVDVPEEALVDLKRRILATRWPDKETVGDRTQGVQLAKLKPLVEYWGTGYDWRKVEAKLNALPQFITEIDGLDIQFAHIRSPHKDAMPMLMTHGWPGSIIELLKVIEPLTDPTAHGGKAEDAFH
ncbi:MAG: twin-arginine translocation signal domain-containing protein, partial [Mesorhizobium sp.]